MALATENLPNKPTEMKQKIGRYFDDQMDNLRQRKADLYKQIDDLQKVMMEKNIAQLQKILDVSQKIIELLPNDEENFVALQLEKKEKINKLFSKVSDEKLKFVADNEKLSKEIQTFGQIWSPFISNDHKETKSRSSFSENSTIDVGPQEHKFFASGCRESSSPSVDSTSDTDSFEILPPNLTSDYQVKEEKNLNPCIFLNSVSIDELQKSADSEDEEEFLFDDNFYCENINYYTESDNKNANKGEDMRKAFLCMKRCFEGTQELRALFSEWELPLGDRIKANNELATWLSRKQSSLQSETELRDVPRNSTLEDKNWLAKEGIRKNEKEIPEKTTWLAGSENDANKSSDKQCIIKAMFEQYLRNDNMDKWLKKQ